MALCDIQPQTRFVLFRSKSSLELSLSLLGVVSYHSPLGLLEYPLLIVFFGSPFRPVPPCMLPRRIKIPFPGSWQPFDPGVE